MENIKRGPINLTKTVNIAFAIIFTFLLFSALVKPFSEYLEHLFEKQSYSFTSFAIHSLAFFSILTLASFSLSRPISRVQIVQKIENRINTKVLAFLNELNNRPKTKVVYSRQTAVTLKYVYFITLALMIIVLALTLISIFTK